MKCLAKRSLMGSSRSYVCWTVVEQCCHNRKKADLDNEPLVWPVYTVAGIFNIYEAPQLLVDLQSGVVGICHAAGSWATDRLMISGSLHIANFRETCLTCAIQSQRVYLSCMLSGSLIRHLLRSHNDLALALSSQRLDFDVHLGRAHTSRECHKWSQILSTSLQGVLLSIPELPVLFKNTNVPSQSRMCLLVQTRSVNFHLDPTLRDLENLASAITGNTNTATKTILFGWLEWRLSAASTVCDKLFNL